MTGSRRYLLAFLGAVVGHGAVLLLGNRTTAATAVDFGVGAAPPAIEVELVGAPEAAEDRLPAAETTAEAEVAEEPEEALEREEPELAERTEGTEMTEVTEPPAAESVKAQEIAPVAASAAAPVAVARPSRPARPRVAAASRRGSVAEGTPGGVGAAGDTRPGYLSNPSPPYPPESRRAGEEGAVHLAVQVDARGRAVSVVVERSSGFPRLDRAATEAVRRWRFRPAMRSGVPVAASVTVPVRFRLN
jgi:protein TonB